MLLDEGIGAKYSAYYLGEKLTQNNNDLEVALIAYNGGQGLADKFVEAGRDWSAVGDKVHAYVKQIITGMGTKALSWHHTEKIRKSEL